MTPTEKAIQSRIKEAFGLKVNNGPLWDAILESTTGYRKKESEKLKNQQYMNQEVSHRSVKKVPGAKFQQPYFDGSNTNSPNKQA